MNRQRRISLLACQSCLDPAGASSRSEVLLAADHAAVSYLAAAGPAVAEDDRSAAAPEAPDGSARDEYPAAGGLDPAVPAESADPAQIGESPVATGIDHCD